MINLTKEEFIKILRQSYHWGKDNEAGRSDKDFTNFLDKKDIRVLINPEFMDGVEPTCDTKIKYPIGGYAPGYYMNKCSVCGGNFMGDKYATQCEASAINMVNESNQIAMAELNKLKGSLDKIKVSCDNIDDILNK